MVQVYQQQQQQPAAPQALPGHQLVAVTCPAGSGPGQMIMIQVTSATLLTLSPHLYWDAY